MDPMKYLGDLAKRNPNMRLGKALQKLSIAAKAEELRQETRLSKARKMGAVEFINGGGHDVGWLSVWEKNRDDIQEAINNLPPGTEFTGKPTIPIYAFDIAPTYDTRRLTPGNCNPCVWGAAPESYTFRGPSENHVVQCIHCGIRPSGVVAADPNAPAGHVIFDRTPADVAEDLDALERRAMDLGIRFFSTPSQQELASAVAAQERIRQTIPADADTERLDVYGI